MMNGVIDTDVTDYDKWKDTYTRIKEAKTDTEVIEAANDYRNKTRDEVIRDKPSGYHSRASRELHRRLDNR